MVTVHRPKGPSEAALAKFEETFRADFGIDALLRTNRIEKYQVIPTGSMALDFAMGVGGYVCGRLTEIWGPDGTGKTTLALIAAANAQRMFPDKMVAFVDMESSLDTAWATKLGVDRNRMYHVQPDSAEELADAVKAVIGSGLVSFVVIDSIGAMVAAEEREKDAGERSVGTTPAIITRMCKLAAIEARKNKTAVLIINQVRANLGYGADTTTGGGFALKHCTTHRLKARKGTGQDIKDGSGNDAVQVATKIVISVEKNKVAPPKRAAEITLGLAPSAKRGTTVGIQDLAQEAFNVGKQSGVIERSGAKYTLPDATTATGEAAVVALLAERPDLVETIRIKALESVAHTVTQSEVEEG